jgi:hypothetical protein
MSRVTSLKARPKMTFNIFMTPGVSCFGQDDRIHDLIPPDPVVARLLAQGTPGNMIPIIDLFAGPGGFEEPSWSVSPVELISTNR